MFVESIRTYIHLILFFRLPFFHLDLSMEPSLEDELWLANLSVCVLIYFRTVMLKWNEASLSHISISLSFPCNLHDIFPQIL